jgi:hypothetical protein
LPTSVPTPEQISIRIADDIFESDNGWDVAAELFGVVTTTRVERLGGILHNTQTSVGTKPSAEQNAIALLSMSQQSAQSYGVVQEFPIGTQLYANNAKIDSLLTRITADAGTMFAKLVAMITGVGADAKFTEKALEEAGGSELVGANSIVVTVTDSADDEPIEAALIRFYRTGQTGTQATDANGVSTFGLDTATWSWAATASGYASRTGTLVVSGDATLPIELVASESSNLGNSAYPAGSVGL